MTRRAYNGVMGYRVVVGIVQVVGPFIDLPGPGFDGLCPVAVLPDIRHPAGAESPRNFRHRDLTQVIRYDKIDQVVDVWQPFTSQQIDRDFSVDTE